MTLILSDALHQAIWTHLAQIRRSYDDLAQVSEHYRIIGLGDLHRRLEQDCALIRASSVALAQMMAEAAAVPSLNHITATMGEGDERH